MRCALRTNVISAIVATMIAPGAVAFAEETPPITLSVAGRANANISMASEGDFVVAVWSASTPAGISDIYSAVSRDAGRTFSAAVRVNSTAGDARTNGEQPPRVALVPQSGRGPDIVVLWPTRRDAVTLLLTARSNDAGATFSRSSVVPDTNAAGNRGWHAVAAARDGSTFGLWLDHRRLAAARQPETSAGHQHGGMDPQLSQLYFSMLDGRSNPMALTGGVCYCCKTAIVMGREGEIHLAWRHVYPGNLRDMAFTSSRDGGRSFATPVRVSEDQWSVEGCPEDGPALAVDGNNRVHIVWTTVVTENSAPVKALFHAMTEDGRSFTRRNRLPTVGQANHPQIAVSSDGSLSVAWDESGDGSRRIVFARGQIAGDRVSFQRQPSSELGTYPVLAPVANGLVTAWVSGPPERSTIRIARR
jgi:hypothetical protein